LIQAGLNPVEAARQAGQAVAYSLILAQEGGAEPQAAPTNARPAAKPAEAAVATPASGQASPPPAARPTGASAPRAAAPRADARTETADASNPV
ncbi:MAG: cell wall hydrolase, partial [Pseudomonadota bacterium]|nr:cell wall hydrolase [Pseudomonadota bacterium]